MGGAKRSKEYGILALAKRRAQRHLHRMLQSEAESSHAIDVRTLQWKRVELRSDRVRLEPLDDTHVVGLTLAANESRDSFAFASVPQNEESTRAYVRSARSDWERGDGLAFATIDAKRDRVVGSTRFVRSERWPWSREPLDGRTCFGVDAVEIGWTWIAPSAQRTPINTHAKLLMLDYAFDVIDVRRVTLKTDARNERSRRAIERIGGVFDGILRAHMQGADGRVRNSAKYSILRAEWPAHRARLQPQHG